MELFSKNKGLVWEFLRYTVVGLIAGVLDMAVNYIFLFYVFGGTKDDTLLVALSVAADFIVGLTSNYILSNVFVFRSAEQREKGVGVKAFLIFAAVGLSGFVITEILTLVGAQLIGEGGFWYLVLTVFVKGIVQFWNYAGRKIFVYRGK